MSAVRPSSLAVRLLPLCALLGACGSAPQSSSAQPSQAAPRKAPPIKTPVADDKTLAPQTYFSERLGAEMSLLAGVFPPQEAEQYVLPFLADHPHLFRDKVVFEIGTGSGLISLFAAKLGARKVICSDISETALACVRLNAEKLGYAAIIEPRLVPPTDMSAYSVLKPGEKFDTLISNPPYSLDLDADHNTALVDNGDLGFSIIRGLDAHLADDGTAALFYATLFFHGAMEKFARYSGFDVRAHTAMGMAPWELEPLFNGYLARLLEAEKLPKDAFRFYKEELPFASVFDNRGPSALVGPPVAKEQAKVWRGFMTIRRKAAGK